MFFLFIMMNILQCGSIRVLYKCHDSIDICKGIKKTTANRKKKHSFGLLTPISHFFPPSNQPLEISKISYCFLNSPSSLSKAWQALLRHRDTHDAVKKTEGIRKTDTIKKDDSLMTITDDPSSRSQSICTVFRDTLLPF